MPLQDIIAENASLLANTQGFDPVKILTALAMNESDMGINKRPRFEKSYCVGSTMYQNDKDLRNNYNLWGAWACCSYSSFQIMFQTAWELGYRGTPANLWDDSVAIVYVIRLLNHRILSKITSCVNFLENVADAYNSGTFTDSIVPQDYIDKFVANYQSL